MSGVMEGGGRVEYLFRASAGVSWGGGGGGVSQRMGEWTV